MKNKSDVEIFLENIESIQKENTGKAVNKIFRTYYDALKANNIIFCELLFEVEKIVRSEFNEKKL